MKTPMVTVAIFIIFLSIVPKTFSVSPDLIVTDDNHHPKTFIVHMARSQKPSLFTSHHHWYTSILNSLDQPSPKLIYTYEKAIDGFAATLTPSQVAKLEALPGILAVLPDETRRAATTHTYKFLGLNVSGGVWPETNYGDGIIIGVIDTGIWPNHISFSDGGMSPVPSSWKGICETSADFPASACNRKIIGARSFISGYLMSSSNSSLTQQRASSARDYNGHGTHVASTAAGAAVPNANYDGFAPGEARGMAPRAHIAIYNVFGQNDSAQVSDIVAAMDQAIADGVHIISFSISGGDWPYYRDSTAIASFRVMSHDILFSAAAGNSGPGPFTAHHLAPWELSVGASSVDREFRADVNLGNNKVFLGASLYNGNFPSNRFYPLVYAGNFSNELCYPGYFDNEPYLAGKIIVCVADCRGHLSAIAQARAVKSVRGIAMILINQCEIWDELQVDDFPEPATRVSYSNGIRIKQYIRSFGQNANATIVFRKTVIGKWPAAPKVTAFSSRGPNPVTPQVLKPDIIAPGLNILAAWIGGNNQFNIISGTSMACPHVSGIAALLKRAHPSWSPSAIKSAIMTTSYNMDNSGSIINDLATGTESTPFVYGSGHVHPNRALDPGLVYDMNATDYVAFLCSIGYNDEQIKLFLDVSCQTWARVTPRDLNLPSFAVEFKAEKDSITYSRRVTNVGKTPNVVYSVTVYAPQGIQMSVSPSRLSFSGNSTLGFTVVFTSTGGYGTLQKFGTIVWSDGTHHVRSPVAFTWNHSPITTSEDEPLASI